MANPPETDHDNFSEDPDDLLKECENCNNELAEAYLEDGLCPDCREAE